uniref:GG10102 n=1 Tax=Drosophila erecta TaxID=7220 RepID=B3P2S8_DROER
MSLALMAVSPNNRRPGHDHDFLCTWTVPFAVRHTGSDDSGLLWLHSRSSGDPRYKRGRCRVGHLFAMIVDEKGDDIENFVVCRNCYNVH